MKKLLLASTALVMSAGVAAADVSLSGDGRMGLVYDGDDVTFNSRARVTFTLSGETDAGLAFGGSFRADNAGPASGGTGGSVFISGDFGRLSMGDVDGAALSAVGDLHFTSLTGLGDRNEMTYLSRAIGDEDNATNALIGGALGTFGNLPRALYSYSIDGFSFFASIDNPAVNRADADFVADPANPGFTVGQKTSSLRNFALGASYEFEGFTGGVGYEDLRIKAYDAAGVSTSLSAKHIIASAGYEFEGFAAKVIAGRVSGDMGTALSDAAGWRRTQYGASVQGSFDEITVSAFGNRNFATTDFGVGAAYDLGGGASITGGIVRTGSNSDLGIERNTSADFGLAFSF